MIGLLIKFIVFIVKCVLMLWATASYAQIDGTPNGAANVTNKIYMFYTVQTGTAPIDSRRLATFVDSTKLIIGVPVYFDSMYRTPSAGNPESFVWIRSSDNRFVWSLKDSIRIPYSQITGTPTIPSGTVTSIGLSSTDFSVSGSPVTTSGNITANLGNSGVSAGTYIGAYTVDAKGRVTFGTNPSIDTLSASRAFNTAYRMSTTGYVEVRPSAQISCNLSLSGGQAGEIYLEVSANGSTGWTEKGRITGSNTGTLTVGLNTTQVNGSQVSTLVPPGYYWRLRTNNTTGSPTYSLFGGEKITY